MFELRYDPVLGDGFSAGRVAVIPWDTQTFGFPVGIFETEGEAVGSSAALSEAVDSWAGKNEVELISATLAPDRVEWLYRLQCAGFRYIDTTFRARYTLERASEASVQTLRLRAASPADLAVIRVMARGAFRHGRYHADVRFPVELADLRYEHWVERAMVSDSSQELLGAWNGETLCGFCVLQTTGDTGDIGLVALGAEHQGQRLGMPLIGAILDYFRGQGVRTVYTTISASNSRIMQTHEKLGARHVDPQVVLHWHARRAPHLRQENVDRKERVL
jgi:RimJ/RimL family protein N-acetyltransferase